MNPRIWVNEIEFNDGTKIQFEKDDITVFVGPNNSGKSASLREINNYLRTTTLGKIITNIIILKEGSVSELETELKANSKKIDNYYKGIEFNIRTNNIEDAWGRQLYSTDFYGFFVSFLTTDGRLKISSPVETISARIEADRHPIHSLYKNVDLELCVSKYFKLAFKADLILDRLAGNKLPLHIGERPITSGDEDRLSPSYSEKIALLDLLHEQGDGMRSFAGILLISLVSHYSILFIDEPEAFLHPPQAKLIGKMLANGLPKDRQLFIATHSEDFLKGVLDEHTCNLKIIRIQRNDKINNIKLLDKNEIRNIWSDPILRHSNVLSGLFHSEVIVCEGDSDCRFYSAILSAIKGDEESYSDILFIHGGGKAKIPTLVNSLKKLDVPIKIISDFDLLNNEQPFRNITYALGIDWNSIENDWRIVKTAVEKKRPELEKDIVKKEVDQIFDNIDSAIMTNENIKAIKDTLKKASPWSEAKTIGKAFIPPGNETVIFERLNSKLKAVGLFIVEVGELESFAKTVGSEGPKWVNEVLTKDLKTDSELENARQFIKEVIKV